MTMVIKQKNYNTPIQSYLKSNQQRKKKNKYIDSFTTGGRDHRIDRFSKEYDYLKQELGIGKYKRRSIPHTLGEALPEIADKMEQEMLKENLGLKDYTND